MFANQPLRNGHPTLHIAITPNAPLDAVIERKFFSVILQFAYIHLFLNQQIRFDIHVCKTVSILFEQMNKKNFEGRHFQNG
jgi:hypothetical protein